MYHEKRDIPNEYWEDMLFSEDEVSLLWYFVATLQPVLQTSRILESSNSCTASLTVALVLQLIDFYKGLLLDEQGFNIEAIQELGSVIFPTQFFEPNNEVILQIETYLDYLVANLHSQFILGKRGSAKIGYRSMMMTESFEESIEFNDDDDCEHPKLGKFNGIQLLAYALDPRYATKPHLSSQLSEKVDRFLREVVERNSHLHSTNVSTINNFLRKTYSQLTYSGTLHQNFEKDFSITLDEEIQRFRSKVTVWIERMARQNKMKEVYDCDPLEWWGKQQQQGLFPVLTKLARWIFCLQGLT